MSTACYSYAVIGCQVSREKLFKEEIITYKHRHTTLPDTNFCPTCGEVVRKKEVEEIDIDDKIGEFELVWSTDQKEAFIGKVAEDSDRENVGNLNPTFMEDPDIFDIKCDLGEVLKPLGMWDESKFGLYAVQYISY